MTSDNASLQDDLAILTIETSTEVKESSSPQLGSAGDKVSAFVTGGSGFLGRNLIRHLVSLGWQVVALARSPSSIKTVEDCGAISIEGDLDSVEVITSALNTYKCRFCFHVAGYVKFIGLRETAYHTNVIGSKNVATACTNSSVTRLVYVSTVSVCNEKEGPTVQVDENVPLPSETFGIYGSTKRLAEQAILEFNNTKINMSADFRKSSSSHEKNNSSDQKNNSSAGKNNSSSSSEKKLEENVLEVVALRPVVIWGNDDSTFVPIVMEKLLNGTFAWLDGGNYISSFAHVSNVCHALHLMATFENTEKFAIGGRAYYFCDKPDLEFKPFVKDLVRSYCYTKKKNNNKNNKKGGWVDMDAFEKTLSFQMLWNVSACLEVMFCCGVSQCCNDLCDVCFGCCCGKHCCESCCVPPISRFEIALAGREISCKSDKIREELGYKEVVSVKEGLADFAVRHGRSKEEADAIEWECLKK